MGNEDFVRPDVRIHTHLSENESDRQAVESGKITEAVYFRRCADRAYTERNRLVAFLASIFPAFISRDEGDDDMPPGLTTVYIETMAGQLSWHVMPRDEHLFAHLPAFTGKWDGHTTEEKYRHLAELGELVGKSFSRLYRLQRQSHDAIETVRGTSAETVSARKIPGVKSKAGEPLPASDADLIRRLGAGNIAVENLWLPGDANAVKHLMTRGLVDIDDGMVALTELGRATNAALATMEERS